MAIGIFFSEAPPQDDPMYTKRGDEMREQVGPTFVKNRSKSLPRAQQMTNASVRWEDRAHSISDEPRPFIVFSAAKGSLKVVAQVSSTVFYT